VVPEGVGVTGVILADQVKNLDWRSRNAVFLATLPTAVITDVLHKLLTLVAVNP
jgi:mRNA interferase MazF